MFTTLHELNYRLEHRSKNDSLVFIIVGIFFMIFFYFTVFYPAPQVFYVNAPNSLFFYFLSTNPVLGFLAFISFTLGYILLGIGSGCYSKLSRKTFLYVSVIMMIIGITILLYGFSVRIIIYLTQGFLVFMNGLVNIGQLYKTKDLVNS